MSVQLQRLEQQTPRLLVAFTFCKAQCRDPHLETKSAKVAAEASYRKESAKGEECLLWGETYYIYIKHNTG